MLQTRLLREIRLNTPQEDNTMPRYLIERSCPLSVMKRRSLQPRRSIAISDQLGVTWIKSYYSAKDGKCYCEYEAPNADLI